MTTVAVIDHGAGNLVSIGRALERAGAEVAVVSTAAEQLDADGVVLPGVGATGAAMHRLDEAGLTDALIEWRGPLLGICVGLQLFFDRSEEDDGPSLGLIPGVVRRLHDTPRLPHIGWNDVAATPDPIFDGIAAGTPFYFVHSYAPDPTDPGVVIATTDYGTRFVSAVRAGQRVGVQFHPERSGEPGLRLLANFVAGCREASRAA